MCGGTTAFRERDPISSVCSSLRMQIHSSMSAYDTSRVAPGYREALEGQREPKGTGRLESSPRQERGAWQAAETRARRMCLIPAAQRRQEKANLMGQGDPGGISFPMCEIRGPNRSLRRDLCSQIPPPQLSIYLLLPSHIRHILL